MLHFCSQCFDRCLIYSLCNGEIHSFQERFLKRCFTWEYPVDNPGWHWAPPCWSVRCTVGWSGSNHYACPCLLENQTGRVRKYAENPAAQSEIWCTNGKRVSECEALRKRLKKEHYWRNTKTYWSRASWLWERAPFQGHQAWNASVIPFLEAFIIQFSAKIHTVEAQCISTKW